MSKMKRWLLIVVAVAVLARAGAILALQSHLVPRSTYEHGEIAASLVEGRGFSMRFLGADGPTSQQAPLYPFLVAAAYSVGGVEQPASLLLLQSGQAVLGGIMVLGVFRLACLVVPGRPDVPWAAAAVAALHPTLVYAATHIQVAPVAAALVVWTLVWSWRAGRTGSRRDASLAGLLFALSVLTDPILGLVALGAFAGLYAARIEAGGTWSLAGRCLHIAVVAGLVVSPWVVRNAMVHGEFVPIKSTFGYAFWQGNCWISQGTDKVVRESVEDVMAEPASGGGLASYNRTVWRARHEAGYIDDVAFTKDFRRLLGTLTEPERSRLLLRMAMADILADPTRYLGLCARRFRYFWLFDETNPRSRILAYRASHLALTGFTLLGLAAGGATLRRRSIPLLATVAAISVFHAATIVSARFHIPIEPLMAVWAGAGIVAMKDLAISLAARGSVPAAGRLEHVGVVGRLG